MTHQDPTHPAYGQSIHHDGSSLYVQPGEPGGGQRLGDIVVLRLRTAVDAPVDRILVRTCPDGEQQFVEMQSAQVTPACRWWQATIRVTMPSASYRFLLLTADGVWWYNGRGLQRHTPTDADDFRLLAGYTAPSWLQDSVFYQIFPDRFADGDPTNNVRDGEFEYRGHQARARRWDESPSGEPGPGRMVEFYGGDLAGIESRLDYLTDLGVNALYLNPIFAAYSNHRYDVVDYYEVDRHLGGNEALVCLRQACHERGLRLILDIVPNHCGVAHPWFQAAAADPAAPTAEYFTFDRHPDDYACWLGARSLPKLNYRSAALRWVMYAGPHSIFRHWLRPPYCVDGWRLDVANMLGRQGADQLGAAVLQGIRQAVKEENQAAYLLGEHSYDGTAQLQGDGLDATMNYAGFAAPLWHWLGGFEVTQHGWPRRLASQTPWTTQALADTWQAFRAGIPWAIARQQFNLLGSHDTPRILTILRGDAGRNRLAAGLLFTYVGVPSVYYGDEVGLHGDATRACMPWQRSAWDEELRSFYQALVRLRRASSALIRGGFQMLHIEEDTLAYLRDSNEEQLIVVGHRGPGTRPPGPLPVAHGALPDGTEFRELIGGGRATVTGGHLPLPAMKPGVMIWRTGAVPSRAS
jgi:alpha-glucosidase